MTLKMMDAVWEIDPDAITPTQAAVLLYLGNWSNDDGRNAYPSVDRIAHATKLTRRSVQRALSDLVALDAMAANGSGGDEVGVPKFRRPTRYDLNLGWFATHHKPFQSRRSIHQPGGVTVAPRDADRGDSVTDWGDSVTKQGRHSDARSSKRSTKDPLTTSCVIDTLGADFETWWGCYPRKVDKARAKKRYEARRKEGVPAEQLVSAAQNYARARSGEEPTYTKHAYTFLGPDGPWTEWADGTPERPRPAGGRPSVLTEADAVNAMNEQYLNELESE